MRNSSSHETATGVPVDRTARFRRWFLPLAIAVVAITCSVLPSGSSLLLHAAGMAAQETDTDGDTMPDAWEDFFGLDSDDAADATGDPDNDGRTNAQEFAARRHPLGHHVRYFAEGSTGYFDTSVAVLNLSATETAHVSLALLSESGGVIAHRFTLGPRQRQSVPLNTVLASGAVAIIVESDVPVAADRFMTWGTSGIGASLDSGASAPATTWYIAEGATGPFFLYYLLQNPATTPATVTVRYLVEGATPVSRTRTLPPQSRTTIFVNEDDPALARASLGAIVTSDVPIFVERAMYLDGGGTLGGGAASAASPQLSTQWYFGEGATGPFFQAFLAMLNPGTTAATATVTYHLADGSTVSKPYTVPAEGRRTVWFNGEAESDPALAALANGPVWFTVSSTQPILGERAMWWSTWPWYEGHAAPGSTTTGLSWAVPEGRTGGPALEQTYLLIGNTTSTAGQIRVTLIPDTGAASTRDLPIPAGQRLTVNVGTLFGLTDARFSVIVDSLGAPGVPLAVDYARYRSVNGIPFSGGGAAPAVLVDAAPTVSSTTPAANATGVAVDANLTVTFSEPVTVGAGAFVLQCPASTPITLTNLTSSPATTFTLAPGADLPVSTACTLRVVASQVTDVDTMDPPHAMAADVVVPFTTATCATITVSPATVPAGTANQPYGPVTFTQTGGTAPVTWSLTAGALPAGLTLSATGVLAGTPTTAGPFTFTATVTDANACTGAVPLTLAVPSDAPTFTSASATRFTVGSAGTFMVTTVGTPTAAITVTGALPAGVTFVDNGNGTGTLSGTPGAATGGSYALPFTASNGVLPNGTQTFTLNVDQAPAVTSAATAAFTVGTSGSFTVTASGFPLPTLARGGVALPAGVTFVDNGNGSGTLSGTPAAGTGGTYAISFTASNTAGASAPQAFTLTVNEPPSITSANSTTFTAGTAGTFTVTALGSPAPAISVGGSLPAGVTFLDNGDGTGTLSGTPGAATGGSYALTYTASNGVLPNGTQSFTLNGNEAPAVTSAATAAFTVGTPGSFMVTTSGFPLPTLARGGVALPAGVTFVDNGNGSGTLSGTPAAGTGGTYAISFTASNTVGASAPQTITIAVTPVNEVPALTNATIAYSTVGNTQLHAQGATLPGLAAVSDANGVLVKSLPIDIDGPVALAAVPLTNFSTPHGTITLAVDGSFTYVPHAGYSGIDTFTVQVTDSITPVAVTVNITVGEVVWYVNNETGPNNPPGSDGRSTDAFETLAEAEAASGPNSTIFVFNGLTTATPLTDSIALKKNGQKLIGEGVGLTVAGFSTLVPAGTQPRIVAAGDAVTVDANTAYGDQTGVEIRGLNLASTSGNAIRASSANTQNLGVRISENTVTADGSGIFIRSGGTGAYLALITGNQVLQYGDHGIFAQADGPRVTGNAAMNLTVTGNTVTQPAAGGGAETNGFHLYAGTTGGLTSPVCVDLRDNTLAGSGQSGPDFRLQQHQSATVRLPGYSGSATDELAVRAFIQGQNPGAVTGQAFVHSPPGGGFVGGAACATP